MTQPPEMAASVAHGGQSHRSSQHERLLYATVTVTWHGAQIHAPDVLVDTGSTGTLLSADRLLSIGVTALSGEDIREVPGVGGTEFVFRHWVDRLSLGTGSVVPFLLQVGELDYGFGINGILGMDFLLQTKAILDLGSVEIAFPGESLQS